MTKFGMIILLGVLCAAFGMIIHMGIFYMVDTRYSKTTNLMYSGNWSDSFGSHVIFSLSFTLLAFSCVFMELSAVGSGIPEVKAFLNGVNLNNGFRIRTILARSFGVIFSVAAGLFVGPDGPLVNIGASLGAVVSRWYYKLRPLDPVNPNIICRDFVTYGTAAALAASFRAPIGGVLFALEEGQAPWSVWTTAKAFVCACTTFLTVAIIDRAWTSKGEDLSSNFALGQFSDVYMGHHDYYIVELLNFIFVGVCGGVFGALIVIGNRWINQQRRVYIRNHLGKRFSEIMTIGMLTAWVTFTLPIIWSLCTPLPDEEELELTTDEQQLVANLVQYNCPYGQYNQVASLLFVNSNTAIKMLFHHREHVAETTFSVLALLIVFACYVLICIVTIGVTASAGAFVPLLVSGALMGRIIGAGLMLLFPDTVADSGAYALVGAGAIMGGACRNVVSVAVILMEATGSLQFALPLMLALVAAKLVGDYIVDGLYQSQVLTKNYPFLAERLPALHGREFYPIKTFMTKHVVTLKEQCTVEHLLKILSTTTHSLFPVVADDGSQVMVGSITRGVIVHLLIKFMKENTSFSNVEPVTYTNDVGMPAEHQGRTKFADFDPIVNDFFDSYLAGIDCSAAWINLGPDIDKAPFFILDGTSLFRAYKYFRLLGLRRLIVIDSKMHVVGILTRTNFTKIPAIIHAIMDKKEDEVSVEMNPMSGGNWPGFGGFRTSSLPINKVVDHQLDVSNSDATTVTSTTELWTEPAETPPPPVSRFPWLMKNPYASANKNKSLIDFGL
jgi:chloride channel 7